MPIFVPVLDPPIVSMEDAMESYDELFQRWDSELLMQQMEDNLKIFDELTPIVQSMVISALRVMEQKGYYDEIRSHLYEAKYRKFN